MRKTVEEVLADELVAKMKAARDKSIAHFEMVMHDGARGLYNIGDVGLKWGDVDQLLHRLETVGLELVMLILGRHYDAGERRRLDRESACELWRSFQKIIGADVASRTQAVDGT